MSIRYFHLIISFMRAGEDYTLVAVPFFTSEWSITKMLLMFFPQCFMVEEQFTNHIFSQAVDRAKNTPLHVIVLYKKIVSDFLTLHAIILALLESGEPDFETSFFLTEKRLVPLFVCVHLICLIS